MSLIRPHMISRGGCLLDDCTADRCKISRLVVFEHLPSRGYVLYFYYVASSSSGKARTHIELRQSLPNPTLHLSYEFPDPIMSYQMSCKSRLISGYLYTANINNCFRRRFEQKVTKHPRAKQTQRKLAQASLIK